MEKKSLVFVVSCLLVLGFSGIAMGTATTHTDITGDNYVTGVDILEYSAEVYAPVSPGSLPQKIKLGLKMNGGHLPAMIYWDFDVDNNLNSGWASTTTGIDVVEPCAGICKDITAEMYEQGWDIWIILVLRNQSDASSMADCWDCNTSRSVMCITRGPQCSNCDKGDCYSIGGVCFEGDPDCYEIIEGYDCYCDDARKCGVMDMPCGSTERLGCGVGLIKGRWVAGFGDGKIAAARGNIDIPIDYDFTGDTELCVELPWGQIVSKVYELKPEIPNQSLHCNFDLSYALLNPPEFQVSAFFDPVFADGEDYIAWVPGGLKLDISDWAPNAPVYGVTADWNNNDTKPCDFDADGDCDSIDAVEFKLGYGSTGMPACFTP